MGGRVSGFFFNLGGSVLVMVCPYGLGIPYIRRWRGVGGGFGFQLLRHEVDFLAVANMRPNFFLHFIFDLCKGIMCRWRRDSHHVLLEMLKE